MICIQCKVKDSVRKSSFCSSCTRKNLYLRNKLKAIKLLGGCCQLCGYNKSSTALQFHHIGEGKSNKEYDISSVQHDWNKMLPELKKCILLCANCHCEQEERLRDEIVVSYTEEQLFQIENYDDL